MPGISCGMYNLFGILDETVPTGIEDVDIVPFESMRAEIPIKPFPSSLTEVIYAMAFCGILWHFNQIFQHS